MKFENIYKESEENVRLALLSLWAPGKHPMRPAIEELFNREKLLAEPIFQSTFGWEPAADESWREAFTSTFIKRLQIGERHKPYEHQAKSWKALAEGRSIVVTSGTGSGKTECFMYPVLNDLCQQGEVNAIEAIFLYPLNALMEDQKERLSEYCQATRLKFAVYNGDTPEYRADGRDDLLPCEVATRTEIRDEKEEGTRPQILLSNPSMLEYILVRQKDQVMLQQSAGKLRWIIIDEAHSYSGSAAVELAYQIKRILEAFGRKANEVRFACTSATIGDEKGAEQLANFIATITGQDVENIQIIGGNRLVKELDKSQLEVQLKELNLPSADKVLSLRRKINQVSGMTLKQIWEWLWIDRDYNILEALRLVDNLCELSQGNDNFVLSLRAHFFMRTVSGLYACANEHCAHANQAFPQYGYLTTEKRNSCPHCDAPMLEIVQCKRCDSFIVMGASDSQTHKVSPCDESISRTDYFAIDTDQELDEIEEQETVSTPDTFFVVPNVPDSTFNPVSKAHRETINIKHSFNQSLLEVCDDNSGTWVEVRKDDGHSYCPCCGRLAQGKNLNMKHFRIPISFINQTISPVLLRESAQGEHTWGKYIAFTDSRQGTAISAKTFNINVERIIAREKTMKQLSQGPQIDPAILAALAVLTEEQKNAVLQQYQGSKTSKLSLYQLSRIIYDEKIFDHITITDAEKNHEAYKAALLRNFIGRKPLYEANIETLGLVTLVYPALKQVKVPSVLQDYCDRRGLSLSDIDWQNFIKIILDYFVRMGNHIQPLVEGERKFIREANISTPISAPNDIREKITRWPTVKRKEDHSISPSQPRIVLLLCAGLNINSIQQLQENVTYVDSILEEAWNTVVNKKILTRVNADDSEGYNNPRFYGDERFVGCYYLDLSGKENNTTAEIHLTKEAWLCPMTNTLLDTTFMGYSPLMVGELSQELYNNYKCASEKVVMPTRPNEDAEVEKWIITDKNVAHLKELGLWNDRHKYSYPCAPSYIAAEHSAQQSEFLLRRYTKGFRKHNPSVNVLHCSTTMEMGVDIGDIDIVLMDTIPPTAANYLQRVGRAGRSHQSKSIAFSLCADTPVGQHAFRNPMWALNTTNHMIQVKESQTIIQRHINSFFFRQFVCDNGIGIQANISVDDFMTSTCDAFIEFLEEMSTKNVEKELFHKVFGANTPFRINVTIEAIKRIQKDYNEVILELENAFSNYSNDERRKKAIASQIRKTKEERLLSHLSIHQFIPNANMPTDVVEFDFMDSDQLNKLTSLYRQIDRLKSNLDVAESESEKYDIKSDIFNKQKKVDEILRSTSASRDIRTALNEYAPGQTVVVNEKNYISAGIKFKGAYNAETQTRAIYHCVHCGRTEYRPNLQEGEVCANCGNPFHGIIDKTNGSYTIAYEPIGFTTDQNVDSSREEKTDKRYYDIQPVLLKTDWSSALKLNMCEVATSGENGNILFYNVGNKYGFAFCKRCGRATVETEQGSSASNIPYSVRPGHKRLWGDECEANENDIARHVVFTGMHPTCYSVLRFKKNASSRRFEADEQLVLSLGVVIRRALAKNEGIDEGEIDFGVKQEQDGWALFIYDVSKGGCGYSSRLADEATCLEVFSIALADLEASNCNCHEDGGACTRCLIDRTNYRFAGKLSKAKALEWLRLQRSNTVTLSAQVRNESPNAQIIYRPFKDLLKDAIADPEVMSLTICVSDLTDDYAIIDWTSFQSEMGKLIHRAIERGKTVNLKVEYHDHLHEAISSKLPFIQLASKFPDCNVQFIRDMGNIKTALIKTSNDRSVRYFIDSDSALSFSNNWGGDFNYIFADNQTTIFENQPEPQYTVSPSEIIREGITNISSFQISKYFSQVIAPCVLKSSDLDFINDMLRGKTVSVTFSDMYVNSALASLMLVYLIKEVRDLFGFDIDNITLQLDSPKRKCNNPTFNDYQYINMNFANEDDADDYTQSLIESVLDVDVNFSPDDAVHHRWLRFKTSDGSFVEIRPDHGISGGYRSDSKYMNIDNLNGSVRVTRNDEDVLYYMVMKKANK